MTAPETSGPAPDVDQLAAALRLSIGLLVRRLRQAPIDDDLTLPETSALARLDRGGPATPTALARLEQISPQSMGATIAALEQRALVGRANDPDDGRRTVISLTDAGRAALSARRNARAEWLARALAAEFSPAELARLSAAVPLIERLAESL